MICLLTLPRGPAIEPDDAEDAHLPAATPIRIDDHRRAVRDDDVDAPRRCGYGHADDDGRRP
jgi:hypothetical protein